MPMTGGAGPVQDADAEIQALCNEVSQTTSQVYKMYSIPCVFSVPQYCTGNKKEIHLLKKQHNSTRIKTHTI